MVETVGGEGTSPRIIKLQPKAAFSHDNAEVISAAHCEAGLCYRRMVKFILYAFGCRFTVRGFIFGFSPTTSVLIADCFVLSWRAHRVHRGSPERSGHHCS